MLRGARDSRCIFRLAAPGFTRILVLGAMAGSSPARVRRAPPIGSAELAPRAVRSNPCDPRSHGGPPPARGHPNRASPGGRAGPPPHPPHGLVARPLMRSMGAVALHAELCQAQARQRDGLETRSCRRRQRRCLTAVDCHEVTPSAKTCGVAKSIDGRDPFAERTEVALAPEALRSASWVAKYRVQKRALRGKHVSMFCFVLRIPSLSWWRL